MPAVLAAAERFRAGGPEALLGIAVGVETICRLSLVAPKRVHQAGFHPTSVFGAMAAAAAVSATLGLDEKQIVDAWGIAGSMASGIIEYLADGSWTKRLHPGWAAQAGLQAALLARAGFTGPRSVFEGTHGLFNGFARGSAGDYGALTRDFGRRWMAETLAFKAYACGTMAHPYIDCAKRLAARGIAAEDVAEILCEVAEGTVHRLWEPLAAKQAPPNAYAAKFSVPFCIAPRARRQNPLRRRSRQSLPRALHRPCARDAARRQRRRGAPSRSARRRAATAVAGGDRGEVHGQRRSWRLAPCSGGSSARPGAAALRRTDRSKPFTRLERVLVSRRGPRRPDVP